MPVQGVPDPEHHWICIRCGQWFEADEGQLIRLERANPVGRLADAISGEVKLRFRCDGCTGQLARRRLIALATLTAILLAAVIASFWLL